MMDAFAVIKETVSLTEMAQRHGVVLKSASSNRHVGCCPFHNEKSPSFTIYPDSGYHCFGCGESGDVIDFVAKMQGLSPMDAARQIDADYGLGLFGNKLSKEEKAAFARQAEQRKHDRELGRLLPSGSGGTT